MTVGDNIADTNFAFWRQRLMYDSSFAGGGGIWGYA